MNVKLPSVRDLVKLYGLSAKQTLSQNFLFDKNITGK
jgi:dimethyladenosine transferase 1